eukprot:1587375-Rhodomonas_salina.2
MFNYWPLKGHAQPWMLLGQHSISHALHRDLHPFGCYVIGHLLRESQEVPDTTHSDWGLEGAFLGWDIATPTVWLWSFRKQEPVLMHDPIFYCKEITAADIAKMRSADTDDGFATDADTDLAGSSAEPVCYPSDVARGEQP